MSLLVPKTNKSRLQLPYGVASNSVPTGYAGFEEPSNAMPGTLSYDPNRDVVRVKTAWGVAGGGDGWQDLPTAWNTLSNVQGCMLAPNSDSSWLDGTYTRIWLCPRFGSEIALWVVVNGVGVWRIFHVAESQYFYDLSGRTSFTPFDLFVYADPTTSVLNFEVINWSSQTARATNLQVAYGVYVKSGDFSRRYMGTCFPRSATQYTLTRVRNGSNFCKLDLWNMYYRRMFTMIVQEPTASWSYDTSTWRAANGSADNAAEFTVGLRDDGYTANVIHAARTTAGGTGNRIGTAVGINSTTVPSGVRGMPSMFAAVGTIEFSACMVELPRLGTTKLTWLERGPGGGGTTTFCGNDDDGDTGMTVSILA